MRFSYVALNQKYQKLTGVISAESKEDARAKLHSMGYSVISMSQIEGVEQIAEEVAANETQPTKIEVETGDEEIVATQDEEEKIITYFFRVADEKNKEITGTIDATDRKNAYRRLISEYHFRVMLLCEISVLPELREEKGKEGLEELAQELKQEMGVAGLSETEKESITQDKAFIEQKDQILSVVNLIKEKAEQILQEYSKQLSAAEVRILREKIGTLSKIKLSNNIPQIKRLADDLYDYIDEITKQYSMDNIQVGLGDIAKLKKVSVGKTETTGGRMDDIMSSARNVLARLKNILLKRSPFQPTQVSSVESIKSDEIEIAKNIEKPKPTFSTSKLLSDLIKTFVGFLSSKNPVEREMHAGKLSEIWREYKTKVNEYKEALIKAKEAIIQRQIEESTAESASISASRQAKKGASFFEEAQIFIGWLLGFYILYFFVAVFVRFKYGEVDFIVRSLDTPFLFLFAGILFFVYMGLSIKNQLSQNSWLKSTLILISTSLLIIVFLVNF